MGFLLLPRATLVPGASPDLAHLSVKQGPENATVWAAEQKALAFSAFLIM